MRSTHILSSGYSYFSEVIGLHLPSYELKWRKSLHERFKSLQSLGGSWVLKLKKLIDHLSFSPYWGNQ